MSTNPFNTRVNSDELDEHERRLRERYLAETIELISRGGCSSCIKARLTSKYTKLWKKYLAAKNRNDQGAVAP